MNREVIERAVAAAPQFVETIHRLAKFSPYFAELLRDAGERELKLLLRDEKSALLPDGSFPWVPGRIEGNIADTMQALRRCKRAGMRHILWWELGLRGDIEHSTRHLSLWAGGLLQASLNAARELIRPRFGEIDAGSFVIIGLGKLGGMELNAGSDVDLLFIWESSATTTSGGRQSVSPQEYYQHLSRMVIRLMSENSIGGTAWPVDMRLRPGGDGSAICLNLDATLDHFCDYGQTWERAMLIKAAPVAGDVSLGECFLSGVRPFIYRRYLDYTTVLALATMKQRIDAQGNLHTIGEGFDVKRGHGGIREIEFFIQSMQLLHGSRSPELQVQPSMQALKLLGRNGLIDSGDQDALENAYRFWRRIEHAIQNRRGEQTHKLPSDFEEYLNSLLLCDDIIDQMHAHAEAVHTIFAEQFAEVEPDQTYDIAWLELDVPALAAELDHLNSEEVNRVGLAMQKIDTQLDRGILPERSRHQVEKIVALCMQAWRVDANGVQAIECLADLFQNIAGRATWIDLLATHESVLNWLIGMLSASNYVAEHLVSNPSWLEWPIESERGSARIATILRQFDKLDPVQLGEEAFLAELGRLCDQARLTSAVEIASDDDADPLMVGGWISDCADKATVMAQKLALYQFGLLPDFPFVAVAMGKHGSRSMGLVSDLDMVFIYLCDDPDESGLGGRSMRDLAQRIGRRMIQHLTLKPPFGAGFELDSRLRPSGAKGALVTTLRNFEEYQLTLAQTWEYQALTRARPVSGSSADMARTAKTIGNILNRPYDQAHLAEEVLAMREKMVEHLASRDKAQINIKQDPGGLVDIEFLAQYARLAFGGDEKGTAGIFGKLPDSAPGNWRDAAELLLPAFLDYRRMENALRVHLWASVGRLPADDTAPEWETLRRHAPIKSVADLKKRMAQIRKLYSGLLESMKKDRG